MLNETGTLELGVNYIKVVNQRPGYKKAEATMLRYQHPVLGDVLVKVIEGKHEKEFTYYSLNGDLIRLPYDYFREELKGKRLMPFNGISGSPHPATLRVGMNSEAS